MILRYKQFYKALAINIFGLLLLGLAVLNNWLSEMLNSDYSFMTIGIGLVFVYGLIMCTLLNFKFNKMLSILKKTGKDHVDDIIEMIIDEPASKVPSAKLDNLLKLSVIKDISIVKQVGTILVSLGLIGTVLGFILAFSGLDPDMIGDVDSLSQIIATMTTGMGVALYTTLAGSICYVWLTINLNILTSVVKDVIIKIQANKE